MTPNDSQKMHNKRYKYVIEVTMVEPCAESPVLELVAALQNEARRLQDARS